MLVGPGRAALPRAARPPQPRLHRLGAERRGRRAGLLRRLHRDRAREARRGARAACSRSSSALLQTAPLARRARRARSRYLIGSFAIDQQRAAVRASPHRARRALRPRPRRAPRLRERVLRVTPDDVLRVARRVIRLDAYTLAAITPSIVDSLAVRLAARCACGRARDSVERRARARARRCAGRSRR